MTINDLINACGTRAEAATIAGTHRDTIQRWLRGDGRPDWRQFLALCTAAGVDPRTIKNDSQSSEQP
jgi:hypothetical protein